MESEREKLKAFEKWSGWLAAALVLLLMIAASGVVYPVRHIIWHISAVLWWVILMITALGQGTVLLLLIDVDRFKRDHGFSLVITMGLGLGALSLETFALGAVGLMTTRSLTLLVLVTLFLSAILVRRQATELLTNALTQYRGKFADAPVPVSVVLATAVLSFPFVLLPTRSFDALVYHLEVPLRYLQAGGVVEISENLYSYAPLFTEMLYGIAIGLQGIDLAGLIYFSFFFLALLAIWRGGAQKFGNAGAAWAAAFTATTPVFLMEVPRAGSDWSMVFYILLVIFLISEGKRDTRSMVLAGVLAGMAAGCRHQALGFAIVIPLCAGLIDDFLDKRGVLAASWGVFLAVSVVVASPWYIKNLIMTGDPIYPLFASILGKTDVGQGFVSGLVGTRPVSLLWEWITFPYRAVFDIPHYNMSATMGVIPLALIPLLPTLRRTGKGNRFLGIWAVLSFFAWYLTFRSFRYVFPVISVLYLWYGCALHLTVERNKKLKKWLTAAVCSALIINVGVFVGLSDFVDASVGAALGTKSPEKYIEASYNVYPAIDYLNKLDPLPGKVLFLGEMRGFYSRFPREVASHNVNNRLIEMAREGVLPEDIHARLTSADFTHILVNLSEWDRMVELKQWKWKIDSEAKLLLKDYLEMHTKTVFSGRGITVQELVSE